MAMPNLPFDYETEQAALKRRQGIIDAMLQQAMQPGQSNFVSNGYGTFYSGPTLLGGLAKAAGMYGLQSQQGTLDTDQAKLQQRYSTGLQSALTKYNQTRLGTPAQNMTDAEVDAGGSPQAASPADPHRAAVEAIASSYAPLREIGLSDLKEASKGQMQLKDLLPYVDPKAIPILATQGLAGFQAKPDVTLKDILPHANPAAIPGMLTGGMSQFQPKSNLGEVNGIVYDKDAKAVVQLTGPRPEQMSKDGDLYEKSPSTGAWRKLDNAPKVTVTNSPVIQGQKAGVQEYFKNAAGQVDALGKQAASAQQLLHALGTLKELHQAGVYSNLTSGAATALNNIAQSLGMRVDTKKLANTEAYNSLVVDLWQRAVSQYGGNSKVTEHEAQEIKRLTPLANTSPQAREQLFQIQSAAAMRSIKAYEQANQSFAEAAAKDDPRLFKIPMDIQHVYTPPASRVPNPQAAPGQGSGFKILRQR